MKTIAFIKDLPFFASFDEDQLTIISKYLEIRTFSEGDVLLKQGGQGSELYIIKSGNGDISVSKPGGDKRHVANTQVGNCYGEVSMLRGDVITANVVALESMECYSFHRDKLMILRYLEPELALRMESAIALSSVNKIETMIQLARKIYHDRKLSKTAQAFDILKPFDSLHDCGHEVIPKNPIFSELNEDELNEILKYCQFIYYPKGGIIQYDDCHAIDVVCTGVLQLFDEVLPKISFNEPGSLYGQITFFDQNVKINAFCREDTFLIRFPVVELAVMCKHDFPIWARFHTIICSQVVKLVYDVDRLILRLESEG